MSMTSSDQRPTPAARLRPSARMHLPREFSRCLDSGKRMGGAFYRCTALAQPESEANPRPRIGFAVSRKVDKRAVVRNRIKRVAREFFRQQRNLLPPGDYVFMGRREAALATPQQLRDDLMRLLPRLCALKAPAAQVTMPAAPTASAAFSPTAEAADSPTPTRTEPDPRAGDDRVSE
ncbi:ribonuclease P protein component [Aquimonas sp.]|jgi:ribonuclease P protein component|uniref:ribonuclease P protein component n=1 Tax=Aquimonas sp. TaxID=1872588 RepID=UPI0037C1206E